MIRGKGFFSLHFSKHLFSRKIAKNSLKKKNVGIGKKESNSLDGTIKLSFWGKNLEGYNLSLIEVKTRQTPSPFVLWTQKHFLMMAQNSTHLENRISEASATVQHIIRMHNQGLSNWTGFSLEFSCTWSNQDDSKVNWNTECGDTIFQPQCSTSTKLTGICHIIHIHEWAKAEQTERLLFINT